MEHLLCQLGCTLGSMQRTEKNIAMLTKLKVKVVIHLFVEIIIMMKMILEERYGSKAIKHVNIRIRGERRLTYCIKGSI
jgi:hypothetical protein